MKKVVFIVTSLNSGGIENYLLRFLTFFDGKIEPVVICKGNTFGELEAEYRKIKHIQLVKMDVGYFNVISFFNIYLFLKRNKINTICDFTGNFAGLILLTAKIAVVSKRITFYRGSTNHFKETKLRLIYNYLMLKLVKRYATKILSNSEAALDYFFKYRDANDSRFKVIYNGIDARKFISNENKYKREDFNIPSNSFVVGHSGRYNSAKNHKTIVKVAEKICNKHETIYFVLCGKDTDKYLKEYVSKNAILKDKVKLLGYRNDVQNILGIFDVYFFPSITEGQPNSLIEAMIYGLPIIASNINPILETTPEEIHNELRNPFDIEGFCDKIEDFFLNKDSYIQNNYSNWAKTNFAPDVLFKQFYNEL